MIEKITRPSYQEHPLYCPCDVDYDTDWHEMQTNTPSQELPEGYLKK